MSTATSAIVSVAQSVGGSQNITKPKPFNATAKETRPCRFFLQMYVSWVELAFPHDPNGKARLFLTCLTARAASWYFSRVKGKTWQNDWVEVEKAFLARFDLHDEDDLESGYMFRDQKETETVKCYADHMDEQMAGHGLQDETMIHFFIRGLKREIALPVHKRRPATFEQAERWALEAETNLAAGDVAKRRKERLDTIAIVEKQLLQVALDKKSDQIAHMGTDSRDHKSRGRGRGNRRGRGNGGRDRGRGGGRQDSSSSRAQSPSNSYSGAHHADASQKMPAKPPPVFDPAQGAWQEDGSWMPYHQKSKSHPQYNYRPRSPSPSSRFRSPGGRWYRQEREQENC